MFDMIHTFFSSVGQFFTNIWDFLTDLFGWLKNLYDMLVAGVNFWVNLLGTLPLIFLGFGTATIIVLIIYQILGRNSGGD